MLGRPLAAVHEIGFGPSFAVDGSRGHDRNRHASLGRVTRARIHDMGVDASFRAEELFVTARGRHGHVLQKHIRGLLSRVPGIADIDRPAARRIGRRAQAVNAAARPGHQRRIDGLPAQHVDHAIDGITFADAAGVEFHARPVEPHGAGPGVEMHMPVTGFFQCGHHFGAVRQMSRIFVKPPNLHQRAHRNIKRPFTLAAVFEAGRKQLKQLFGNPDRALGGVLVHTAPLAGGLIIRQ